MGRGTPFPYVFSVHSYLLPFLEEQELKNLIDPTSPPLTFGANSGATNALAANTLIPLFLCPSDRGSLPESTFGPNNYVGNVGSGLVQAGFIKVADGVFFDGSKISMRHITDGSTFTIAFSESLLGPGDQYKSTSSPPAQPQLEVVELSGGSDTTDTPCTSGSGTWSGIRGAKWINGHFGDTLYNHYYRPNALEWDCGNASHNHALTAPRSMHPGGVQAMFCDGHVDFVINEIDLALWRAYSTRAGNEVIDENAVR
jgi:prepilin-type processing-associated H-X9-DG protein